MALKVLVTGGAGFIGSHTVDELIRHGHEPWILDSMDTQVHGPQAAEPDFRPDYLPPEIRVIRGDIRDRRAVEQALKGADAVLHLAAKVGVGQSMYQISEYMTANTVGTSQFLEVVADASTRPEKIVVASSMSIYGEGAAICREHGVFCGVERKSADLEKQCWEPLCPECSSALSRTGTTESCLLKPTSPYAIGKQDQEQLVLAMCRAYGIHANALRYFNVYGARQALSNPYTGVGAIFSSRLLNNKAPVIFEDGLQTRDFIHVSDVARANRLAIESDITGHSINIGTGIPVSISDVARKIAEYMELDIEPVLSGKYRAGDIRHCFANTRLAEKALGFKADVDFNAGIPELVNWVKTQKSEDFLEQAMAELVKRGLTR